MDIYNYDDLGVFLSRGQARLDPLETAKDPSNPVYMIPAKATTIMPPAAGPNQVAVFSPASQAWSLEEDHRGKVAYAKKDGTPQLVTALGSISSDLTVVPPPNDGNFYAMADSTWTVDAARTLAQVRTQRNALLAASDYTQLADSQVGSKAQAWKDYRQSLRDYPSNWYAGKPWPTAPQ